jgi:hypothetical protein
MVATIGVVTELSAVNGGIDPFPDAAFKPIAVLLLLQL